MNYESIWQKTLGKDETVEYEFSIRSKYTKINLIVWGIISVPLLLAAGLGVVTFLIALFYYGFYLKKANAYAFTSRRVLIHKGWLSTKTVAVDYPKITDVHISESFLERMLYHTGSIAVNTAGSLGLEVVLRNVEAPYEIKKKLDELKDKTYGKG